MNTSTFALIIGLAFTAAGVLGLIPVLLLPPPADAPSPSFTLLYGYLLGLFPVNLLHTAVHFAIGLWGLAAWQAGTASSARFARALAVLYGALAVMGLIPGLHTVFGLIPIHGHDVWLHAATALAAAWFGFRSTTPEARVERRGRSVDRRTEAVSIAYERRQSAFDRRHGSYGGTPLAAGF
jgi:hypothetical protein